MLYTDFSQLLTDTIGLSAATIGASAIERAVRQRQTACGIESLPAYWHRLRESPAERQELIEAVVVPESWFFRDRETFTALSAFVGRDWLPRHDTGVLRLLSLPCSTGEEPYSMAMALLDAGVPPDRFRIDAVDISRRALAHAERALYREHSFRGWEPSLRLRHFTRVDGHYQLSDEVRRQVAFRHGNLCATDPAPGAPRYDVVFCRNLLIYFDATALDRAVSALGQLLAPGGLLFVAPSETAAVVGRGLVPRGCRSLRPAEPARTRRRAARRPSREGPAVRPDAKPARRSAARGSRTAGRATPPEAPARLDAALEIQRATRLADQGRFAEAEATCEQHLREHGPSAHAFYLLGLLGDAAGDRPAAVRHYRKALYLDPSHREALAHLALLLEQQGHASRARVLRDRARRLQEASGD